jgi:O-antigen/teichoic acid export membrane protein
MLSYGSQTQISNLIQLLNYRIGFYILEKLNGPTYEQKLSYIGILSIGMQIAESLWIVSRSAASGQYAEISHAQNNKRKLDITYKTIRVSCFITIVLLIPLLFIPDKVYTLLLGKDFDGLQNIIQLLSPGILLYTIAVGISHYFSGTGIFIYNLTATGLAFIISIAGGIIIIPSYFQYGAAAVSSASHVVMAITLLIIFWSKQKLDWKDLIIRKNDISIFLKKLKK